MIRRFAAFACALAVAACASIPAPQPLPQLSAVPASFEVNGRLAVRQGDRSDIAKLRWTRHGGSDVWVIASPLGNEVARVESDARGATLIRGGTTQPERAGSFQALTERLLGVPLDPALMAQWLHGVAPADAPGEWKVTLEETQRAGAIDIAKRITASRGDVVVRLVVDEYRVLAD
jgi:outer membrane biogenesis lipoprotein LolB